MITKNIPQLLTPSHSYLEVFISYTGANKNTADHYANLVRPHFTVWQFQREEEMLAGADIHNRRPDPKVERAIRECDFFLLLICDDSMSPNKTWCARELGLALQLQRERFGKGGMSDISPRPIIIPVFSKGMAWREKGDGARPTEFFVRQFSSNAPEPSHKLETFHDPHARYPAHSDTDLLDFMKPRVLRARRDFATDREFDKTKVFDLYKALFPPIEQDDTEDIKEWVLRLENGERRPVVLPKAGRSFIGWHRNTKFLFQLDALFYVISLYGNPIAFSYLDYHQESNVVIANYIAVGNGWRGSGLAHKFRNIMEEDVVEAYPRARGVLFAIEQVDFKMLGTFVQTATRQRLTPGSAEYAQIRRLKRLAFYQRMLHANVFIDAATREPMIYTDPCLDIELPQDEWKNAEEDYWLLWYSRPNGGRAPTWDEAVRINCLEVQAKSMVVMDQNTTGAAYWSYACRLTEEIGRRATGKRVVLDRLPLTKMWGRLSEIVENFGEIAI